MFTFSKPVLSSGFCQGDYGNTDFICVTVYMCISIYVSFHTYVYTEKTLMLSYIIFSKYKSNYHASQPIFAI